MAQTPPDPNVSFDPDAVRARLLDELHQLPPEEHLAALAAVERHDLEFALFDGHTLEVSIAGRWNVTMSALPPADPDRG